MFVIGLPWKETHSPGKGQGSSSVSGTDMDVNAGLQTLPVELEVRFILCTPGQDSRRAGPDFTHFTSLPTTLLVPTERMRVPLPVPVPAGLNPLARLLPAPPLPPTTTTARPYHLTLSQ